MISIQWNQETAELPLSEGVDHRTRLSEKLQNLFEPVLRLPYIIVPTINVMEVKFLMSG